MGGPSFHDILRDRTHKYRRTLLGICLILIALYWFPNLDFRGLSLFGIKPGEDAQDPRTVILIVVWLAWLYHVVLFYYYAQRDWKDWRFNLSRESERFDEIGPYLGLRPSADYTRRQFAHH